MKHGKLTQLVGVNLQMKYLLSLEKMERKPGAQILIELLCWLFFLQYISYKYLQISDAWSGVVTRYIIKSREINRNTALGSSRLTQPFKQRNNGF